LDAGESIILPVLTTIVYAFASADAKPGGPAAGQAWERVLERAWAVIVIDFLYALVVGTGMDASLRSSPAGVLTAVVSLSLGVFLIFADASATLDDGIAVWWIVPVSLLRSIAVTLRAPVFSRALVIFSLQLLVYVLASLVAAPWAQIVLNSAAVPPIAALTALVYRDATRGTA
jgi:hypothetical protein